jgi:hypothetical protein
VFELTVAASRRDEVPAVVLKHPQTLPTFIERADQGRVLPGSHRASAA